MQFDKKTFTVPVTSGGTTATDYPTDGFVPQDAPAKLHQLFVSVANFANAETVTVALIDGATSQSMYASAGLARNTTYTLNPTNGIVIGPGDYFKVTPSGDIGATLQNVTIRMATER